MCYFSCCFVIHGGGHGLSEEFDASDRSSSSNSGNAHKSPANCGAGDDRSEEAWMCHYIVALFVITSLVYVLVYVVVFMPPFHFGNERQESSRYPFSIILSF